MEAIVEDEGFHLTTPLAVEVLKNLHLIALLVLRPLQLSGFTMQISSHH